MRIIKHSLVSNLLCTSLLSIVLLGCSLHTETSEITPLRSAQESFSIQSMNETQSITPWWYSFNRESLNNLIDQSLSKNLNIMEALARVQQAEAITIQSNSRIFPNINADGTIQNSWEGSDKQRGQGAIGASLQWEVDTFGRLSEAARADKLRAVARVEDVDSLRLSLSADVANAYFGAVASHRTLDLLNQQVATDQDLLELLQLRQREGLGTSVEVLQQKSRVLDSKSLIPLAESNLRVFENRLDVLLGTAPDAQNRVANSETLDFAGTLPPIGVPADLLLKRPDLRAAQADLMAADADIGVAIANRLPQITLTGSYAFSDTESFTGPVSMIMAGFVQPLLDWGQRKAEVERTEAVFQEKLAAFTQLYLRAVEDVENALYQENRQREFIRRLQARSAVLQKTVDETEARYTQGVDDYLPVLTALQELRDVERRLIIENLNLIQLRIALYRAVGGSITHNNQDHGNDIL